MFMSCKEVGKEELRSFFIFLLAYREVPTSVKVRKYITECGFCAARRLFHSLTSPRAFPKLHLCSVRELLNVSHQVLDA